MVGHLCTLHFSVVLRHEAANVRLRKYAAGTVVGIRLRILILRRFIMMRLADLLALGRTSLRRFALLSEAGVRSHLLVNLAHSCSHVSSSKDGSSERVLDGGRVVDEGWGETAAGFQPGGGAGARIGRRRPTVRPC